MFSTTNKAQKCRVWCECLKKPCHRIWSITLSGGRLGAEGTCNFQVEWWDWLAAHFLSCDPGPASYCTPCTKWSSISAQWRRPFCARLFPPPTVLLIIEEEKILKIGAFHKNPTATWKPTLRVLWLQYWYFKLSRRRIHWILEVIAHILWRQRVFVNFSWHMQISKILFHWYKTQLIESFTQLN